MVAGFLRCKLYVTRTEVFVIQQLFYLAVNPSKACVMRHLGGDCIVIMLSSYHSAVNASE